MIYSVKELVIDYRAREWCKLPYPDHPRGCPNYGKKDSCPPNAPLIEDFVDIRNHLWLIAIEFDLTSHVQRMLSLHPKWSNRQARCVLYWQPRVNRELREATLRYSYTIWGSVYTLCPEAMGVDVIKTARKCGIPIVSRPIETVYKVALIGYPPNFDFERDIIRKGND